MTRKITITSLFTTFLLGACLSSALALQPVTMNTTVEKVYKVENLVRIADNVIIMFDSSGSMGDQFGDTGKTKLQAAKSILKERTEVLPEAIPGLKIGLYSYTPSASVSAGPKTFEVYKTQAYSKAGYVSAINLLPDEASGPTLMVNGLRRLGKVLDELSGHSVVFFFTDGTHSDQGATDGPLELAQKIAAKHDVSFQIISTTDVETELKLMKAVASINESSRVHPFEDLINRPEVYLGAVFVLEEQYITAAESRNEIIGFKLDHILFEFGKSKIMAGFTEELNAVGKVLRENPDSYVVLTGHTDSKGGSEANLALSHRRVEAIGAYLEKEFDIAPSRIEMFWYGSAAPITTNDTAEGREQNRRVVGFIAGVNM